MSQHESFSRLSVPRSPDLISKNRAKPKPTTAFWSFYLTKCIYLLLLERQLAHETVYFIFRFVIVNNKLTILWGSWLSKTDLSIHSVRTDRAGGGRATGQSHCPHLTQSINWRVLESQLPHKIDNLIFDGFNFEILWGSWLSKTLLSILCVRYVRVRASAGVPRS